MSLLFETSRTTKSQDEDIINKSRKKQPKVSVSNTGTSYSLIKQKLGKYSDKYTIIRTQEELHDYMNRSIEKGVCAIDTETTGLNVWHLKLGGVCIYTYDQKPAYVPVNHVSPITNIRYQNQCTEDIIKQELQYATDKEVKWIMHNAAFDIKVLIHTCDIRLSCYWDTQLAAQCINQNGSHTLKDLHLELCPDEGEKESITYSDLFKGMEYLSVPIDVAYLYAAGDAIKTMDLYDYQLNLFQQPDWQKVYDVFMNIEMPVVDVVVDMEEYGVMLDKDYSHTLSVKYNNLLSETQKEVDEVFSKYYEQIKSFKDTHINSKIEIPVNISSPQQLSEFFYDILEAPVVDTRKPRGTGEDILKELSRKDIAPDVCNVILKYREIYKLISTYIDKLPNSTESDGRIHCKYNQYGAQTGRFSCSEPNLQNIPSHNKEIRKMFTAPKGRVFIGADFSQQEPVVTAHLSNDDKMREAFEKGRDIYSTIAAVSFHKSYEDCLEFYLDENGNKTTEVNKQGKEYRGQAKQIVLGILYGRAIPSIAEQLNVDNREAQNIYDAVLKAFPKLKEFMEESQENARQLGYVETAWGRRRYLPDMQLKPFEYKYKDSKYSNFDPLSFRKQSLDVPINIQNSYTSRLLNERRFKNRQAIKEEAKSKGIDIKDNTKFIEDATRQCVNSRVQGSAADMTKKVMIAVRNDKIMQDLDFHLILQVHDELIGECPRENAKACSERLSYLMINSAKDKISIPMKCDPSVTECWYGEELEVG